MADLEKTILFMNIMYPLDPSSEMKRFIIAGYLDPGTGYVFSSFVSTIAGLLSTLLVSSFISFRKTILRHRWISLALLLTIVSIVTLYMVNHTNQFLKVQQQTTRRKVLILGFDGMDPDILAQGFKRGMFPNLHAMKETGFMSPLHTVVPPQSPVVWASFITGMNPSKHHLYDFIKRDPSSYTLDLVFTENSRKEIIQSPTLWGRLSEAGIPSNILFLPDTFPPSQLNGTMISGMGVPDITGTEGTSVFFSSRSIDPTKKWRGTYVNIRNDATIKTTLPGPKYTFFNNIRVTEMPITIRRLATAVEIELQGTTITLHQGKFSAWIPVEFTVDVFTKIHGIVKFYLTSLHPDLEVYASPINFDPFSPVYPISYPYDTSKKIAGSLGAYSTLGLPQDTWALEQGAFDEQAFIKQTEDILKERTTIIFHLLKQFHKGVFIAYFGMTDTISHMFWRYKNTRISPYNETLLTYYQKMDNIVGETLKTMTNDDVLIVLSDHGFGSFDYEMNLNSWLRDNGYLTLKNDKKVGDELFADIDWSKTKAYAAGYNGIYLNEVGREQSGVVRKEEIQPLLEELRTKLLAFTNPFTHEPVVKQAYLRQALGIKDTDMASPDLFIGYFRGVRSSWTSAVGGVSLETIQERKSKWSGDHLFDPSEVPGVLLTNKKIIDTSRPISIIDVLPSILELFGIPKPNDIDGTSFITNIK